MNTVDVTRVIEQQKFGPLLFAIVAWSFAIMLTDGFDLTGISFAAPSLVHLWGVPKARSAGVQHGPLRHHDRIDRFRVSGRPHRTQERDDLRRVSLRRVYARVGTRDRPAGADLDPLHRRHRIGGAVPVAMALNTEFAPKAWRATIVIVMFTGYTTGAAIGGFVAAWLIPAYGWQACFTSAASPRCWLP